MTVSELERMRAEVMANRAVTVASTERLQKMLEENVEDMVRHDNMLAILDKEIALIMATRTGE
jgi:hypothetical protein